MADRVLTSYEEPGLDDGPHWTAEISRSAAGQPAIFVTLRCVYAGSLPDGEMTVYIDDGDTFLAPVLEWLAAGRG